MTQPRLLITPEVLTRLRDHSALRTCGRAGRGDAMGRVYVVWLSSGSFVRARSQYSGYIHNHSTCRFIWHAVSDIAVDAHFNLSIIHARVRLN